MHSRQELALDLRNLGLTAGAVVWAHASVRAIGPVAGGPDEIHLAIKDAIIPEGTLMMYAGCQRYVDEVGRGNLTPAEEAEILEKFPPFDALTARSARDNGALVEFFRTWPGTRVNDHITRFVAWGRHASHLLADQPWDYAYGHNSVIERFGQLGGMILLLGSDRDNVTFLHHAEHIVDIPDKVVARYQVPVLENGKRVWRFQEEFDSSTGAHASWPDGFFAKIVDGYLDKAGNRGGLVGSAHSYLIPAQGLLGHALAEMKRTALGASPS